MIKQIQLRGISRSPSDRLTSDGGCAESLNVQLDHGEITPMPKPEDLTADVLGSFTQSYPYPTVLFIHKGTYYSNYIVGRWRGWSDPTLCYYDISAIVDGQATTLKSFQMPIAEMMSKEAEVTSVGNTLIVSFNGEMWYFLFKDGVYKPLGNQIPIPKIRFYMKSDVSDRGAALSLANVGHNYSDVDTLTVDFVLSSTARYADKGASLKQSDWGTSSSGYKVRENKQIATISVINDEISNKMSAANDEGKCIFPIFLRYAVRLYDGSLYACSAPILLGNELSEYLGLKLISIRSDRSFDYTTGEVTNHLPIYEVGAAVRTPSPYKIVADFTDTSATEYANWDDIIEGIDLFVSTQITPYLDYDKILLSNHEEDTPASGSGTIGWFSAYATLDPISMQKPEKLISSHQTTFFAKRWLFEELETLTTEELSINYGSDWLSTQEPMVETYGSIHKYSGQKLESYNNRLLIEGAVQDLYGGYPYYTSTTPVDYLPDETFSFIWHLKVDGENRIVRTSSPTGSYDIGPQQEGAGYNGEALAWLAYPDARAFRVDVCMTVHMGGGREAVTYRSFPLKSSSQIDVAYFFNGFGKTLADAVDEYMSQLWMDGEEWDTLVSRANIPFLIPDQIFMSKNANPFIFPASGVIDFDNSNILGTAMVTKALSQGQFGQYPLYVFTSTGIWALGLNSEGDFVSKHAVSRDVALEGTIAPIDQAIVFTTKKGVMMLSGSDIASISPDMNGKHYILDTDAATLLGNNGLAGVIQASQNPETFQQFMETAKPVYDYVGERLVFGSNEYGKYMYVYRLPTGTWHKMTLIEGNGETLDNFSVVRALNSYPDAIMSLQTNNGAKVINLSVVLDHSEAEGSEDSAMETSLIVTRPFDLDAPDVRKVIKDIRIRGQFNREDVKYILLGSFDGINWKRLTSLRGGSFKLFRMVIVANLSPNERISWIDVDYDTRFTNRLR